MNIDEIVSYVAFTVYAALMVVVVLGARYNYLMKKEKEKEKDDLAHDNYVTREEAINAETIEGPKGEFLVEPQDDGQWAVIQLHYPAAPLPAPRRWVNGRTYSRSYMDVLPTLTQAFFCARRRAGLSEVDHPLPDRRAAIAHTKALS